MTWQSKPAFDTRAFSDRVKGAGGDVSFVFGDDRPFAQCHAPTLVETAGGGVLCAWFGGIREGDPGVSIWRARRDGRTWGPVGLAAKVSEFAHWNPVLFRDPARATFLFFKAGVDTRFWQTYWMATSGDDDWSMPVELVPGDRGGRGPVKNKPLLRSGAWLAPGSTEFGGWGCFADRSEDGGLTWKRSAYFRIRWADCPGKGAIQPTFWESEPGRVHALMRTTCGRLTRSDSDDDGHTWSLQQLTDLPSNNSGIDLARLDDGRLLLAFNPVAENWGQRNPLALALSDDNGASWRCVAHLEDEAAEFSYPAVIPLANGVAVAYTWKRERIRFWHVPLEALP
jgi:predicted neuraminidase